MSYKAGSFDAAQFKDVFGLETVDESQAYSEGSSTGTKQTGALGTYMTKDDYNRLKNDDKVWDAYASINGDEAAKKKRKAGDMSINTLDSLMDKLSVSAPAKEAPAAAPEPAPEPEAVPDPVVEPEKAEGDIKVDNSVTEDNNIKGSTPSNFTADDFLGMYINNSFNATGGTLTNSGDLKAGGDISLDNSVTNKNTVNQYGGDSSSFTYNSGEAEAGAEEFMNKYKLQLSN